MVLRRLRWLVSIGALSAACAAHAACDLTLGAEYRESCDGLTNSLPAGWLGEIKGEPANPARDDGSSTTGGLYLYGAGQENDRALGSLASGSRDHIRFGVVLRNADESCVAEVAVAFTGEQWRSAAGLVTNLLACYGAVLPAAPTNLAAIASADRFALPFLNFTSIVHGAGSALDGNDSANRCRVAANFVPPRALAPGHFLALWWHDSDDAGGDHGLAVDDLTIRWAEIAPPAPARQLLAFWHCNAVEEAGSFERLLPLGDRQAPLAYDCDAGALTGASLHAWTGLQGVNGGSSSQNFGAQAGSVNNWPLALGAAVAGHALAISGPTNNGGFVELRFDRAVTNLVLTYATRGTGAGFTNHSFSASNDWGTNWMACGAAPADTQGGEAFRPRTNAFDSVFACSFGPARNRIRVALSGATYATGNNGFDNIRLEGAFPLARVTGLASPPQAGRVDGAGWHEVGAQAVLRAEAASPGWLFGSWSDGVRTPERAIVVPAAGAALTARFYRCGILLLVR